jgi:hypothetical protein
MSFLISNNFQLSQIPGDGNCFYKAVAEAYYKDQEFHKTLRHMTMNRLVDEREKYAVYLSDNITNMMRTIAANRRLGVWNTEISDLAVTIVPELLKVTLKIHDVNADTKINTITIGESETIIHLLRTNGNHYDLLTAIA